MSEVVTKKSLIQYLGIGVVVLMLLLAYGAGFIALPIVIQTNYQSKNCDAVLSLSTFYSHTYPSFIQDKSLSSLIDECGAYQLATASEAQGNWRTAYDAYQVYLATYPNGLYKASAHEHSGIVLLNTVKEQVEQKKYEEALVNLNQIVASYADTHVLAEALTLFPTIYTSQGMNLREAGEFEKAEQVLNEFKTWSQNNQNLEAEQKAQSDLAQTYLAWGVALQTQQQFEAALTKFDQAASTNPDTLIEAKSDQCKTYLDWGNKLLGQGEFSTAIDKFQLAQSKSDETKNDVINEALMNGHLQWAHSLSAAEDFQGALEQLSFAEQAAVSEAMKKTVQTAFEETYLAFSNSSGTQARQAMRAAMVAVCDKGKKPDLPIFGLDKNSIKVGVYNVEVQLPDTLGAKTPAEIHYIACIEPGQTLVTYRYHKIIVQFADHSKTYVDVKIEGYRVVWTLRLLKSDSGDQYRSKVFEGGPPPPFPPNFWLAGDPFVIQKLYGTQPDMHDLVDWLQSVIQ